VVPSLWAEPLGVVVFEGMAYGTPVIASRRGGIPEMIDDGVDGLLFDPDNVEELLLAMNRMGDDAEFRKSASFAARDAAKYYFDIDRFLSSYECLYHNLIS